MGGLGPSSRRVRSMPGLVRCGNCSELRAEPSDLPEAQRRPCPHCGAKHRTFEKNLAATVAVSADVVVAVSAASARAGTGYPTGSIARLEDAGFDLQCSGSPRVAHGWCACSTARALGSTARSRTTRRRRCWRSASGSYRRQNRPTNRMNPAVAIIVGLERIRAALGA
jgi:hypothetical protein